MSIENKNTQLAVLEQQQVATTEQFSAFGSITHFEAAQRMAMALCSSSIVPETYRGKERLGDCVIALEISNRIGASVLAVMQNLYIVYGRPAWSSQFLISCVNASRRFSPLRYKTTGNRNDDSWGCIAWAEDKSGEKLESPEVTIAIAKAEGWYQKNGSKWKTMPELMLRYRAATFFARLYAPELTMGIQSDDEVIDISPVVTEPTRPGRSSIAAPEFATLQLPAAPAESKAAESSPAKSRKTEAAPLSEESQEADAPAKAPTKQPELTVVSAPDRKAATPQDTLAEFLTDAGVTFDQFRRWAIETQRIDDGDSFSTWSELPAEFCAGLQKDGKALNRCITRCKTYTPAR
jgi:hypothetical protein